MTRKFFVAIALVVATTGAAPGTGTADGRGEALFDLCKQCHGPDAGGMTLALAPAIAGLDQWYVEAQLRAFQQGLRGLHPADTPGMRMYPMSLWLKNDEDVAAVSSYVASLPVSAPERTLEGGDASVGKTLYTTCAACHGHDGAGNEAMNTPPLRGTSDWYLLSSLQRFKAGVRGFNPKNPNAVMMRPMAGTLADDQAMKDVIAHIMTLGN